MTVVEVSALYFESLGLTILTVIIYFLLMILEDYLKNENDPKNEDNIKKEDG